MHSNVRDVWSHIFQRGIHTCLQVLLVSEHIVEKEMGAELEPLGPLCPSARSVFTFNGENRRSFGGIPIGHQLFRLNTGHLKKLLQGLFKIVQFQFMINYHVVTNSFPGRVLRTILGDHGLHCLGEFGTNDLQIGQF